MPFKKHAKGGTDDTGTDPLHPMSKERKFATNLQHGGYDPVEHRGHRGEPLYLDVAVVQPNCTTAAERFSGVQEGQIYYRFGGEDDKILEKRLALLEGGDRAKAFASGLAAIQVTLLALTEPGDHIVSASAIYGGTYHIFTGTMTKDYGRTVTFVHDINNIDEVRAALRPNTKIVFAESISNPTNSVLDIEPLAAFAKEKRLLLVIDNTFATPHLFRPIKYGADLSIHSTTKFLTLGGTNGGGAVIGSEALMARVRERANSFGAAMSEFDAWCTIKGLQFLAVRVDRQSASALTVARYLAKHPRVRAVHYPGIPNSKNYFLAKKYLPAGCGAIVALELEGAKQDTVRFMEALELFSHVINLGDVHSLATHPASTTHSKVPAEELARSGISETFVRLSIGLEDVDDLLEDLEQALRKNC